MAMSVCTSVWEDARDPVLTCVCACKHVPVKLRVKRLLALGVWLIDPACWLPMTPEVASGSVDDATLRWRPELTHRKQDHRSLLKTKWDCGGRGDISVEHCRVACYHRVPCFALSVGQARPGHRVFNPLLTGDGVSHSPQGRELQSQGC